jgi:transposase
MKSVSSSRKLFPVVPAPKVSAGERSEPKRAVGAGTTAALAQPAGLPLVVAGNSEVVAKASRRRFTVDDKLKILQQADACQRSGELGALLRREGLYSSSLALWRDQRQQGILSGLTPRTRGRKPNPQSQLVADNEQLKRQNQKLSKRLQQAEIIIEFQKNWPRRWGFL